MRVHLQEAQNGVEPAPAKRQSHPVAIPAWGDQARSVRASRTLFSAARYNPPPPFPAQRSERLGDWFCIFQFRMQDLKYHAIHDDGFPYARCFFLVVQHPTYRPSSKHSFSIALRVSFPSKRLVPPGHPQTVERNEKNVRQAPSDRWITYPLKVPKVVAGNNV